MEVLRHASGDPRVAVDRYGEFAVAYLVLTLGPMFHVLVGAVKGSRAARKHPNVCAGTS